MPRKANPTPELAEPYEQFLYADLRHELALREIRIGSGPQRITKRTGFIAALRKWDRKRGQPAPPQPQEKRTSAARKSPAPRKPSQKPQHKQPPTRTMTSTRVVRARRGCRFRLINVLLSADFNGRWAEMVAGGRLEVNQLWLDVHAAFLAQNSELDTLHFQDALFVNVTPNVILTHSAERLLQMWAEIVAMYRTAVVQAKDAAAHNDNVHSFFDFCAGRLDLLYLHMAMLLEPKLYEFIMSDKIPAVDPFARGSKATAPAATATTTVTAPTTPAAANMAKQASKPKQAAKAATPTAANKAKQTKKPEATVKAATPKSLVLPKEATTALAAPPSAAAVTAVAAPAMVVAAPACHAKPSRVPTQNPEMEEAPVSASAKDSTTVPQPKVIAAKAIKSGAQAKPTALPHKPAAHKKPQKAAGKGKTATGTSLANETKQTASPSKQKPAPAQAKQKSPSQAAHAKASSQTAHAKAPSKPSNRKASLGAKPASAPTPASGKRRREEDSTAIVEVPSVSDIVPHAGKRAHTTTTTTISTLATRPADAMLPPDEWDILENRLRKVNENIDRCHRGLASVEGGVSEGYKQSLEADLRFYSAIKQRLQEQLLVVMQSGY
jgi:chemotaxis protein histidine kinase CheA